MTSADREKIIGMLCSCKGEDVGEPYFQELRKKGENLKKNEIIEKLNNFLSALGNKDRLMIVDVLKKKDLCVCELEAILDKSQPAISHHLKILEECGLIRGWKKGRFTYYSIEKEVLSDYIADFKDRFEY